MRQQPTHVAGSDCARQYPKCRTLQLSIGTRSSMVSSTNITNPRSPSGGGPTIVTGQVDALSQPFLLASGLRCPNNNQQPFGNASSLQGGDAPHAPVMSCIHTTQRGRGEKSLLRTGQVRPDGYSVDCRQGAPRQSLEFTAADTFLGRSTATMCVLSLTGDGDGYSDSDSYSRNPDRSIPVARPRRAAARDCSPRPCHRRRAAPTTCGVPKHCTWPVNCRNNGLTLAAPFTQSPFDGADCCRAN